MKKVVLFVSLGLALTACKKTSAPPQMEVCILDGFGGGDCVEADGTKLYRAPSAMANYWSTNEPDMNNLTAWCYSTTIQETSPYVVSEREKILEK